MYKRILVAIDGSATSLHGLNEAIRLAKATGGELMLVHVVNELLSLDFAASAYYDKMIESLREAGAKVLEQATTQARRAEVPCEHKLLEAFGGRAAELIVIEAKAWPADLIALGTHGRRGLKRLALGSDAELVVRTSPVPVLLVRDQPEPLQ
jgi:nucleotide-binding universal stress UspA family protein